MRFSEHEVFGQIDAARNSANSESIRERNIMESTLQYKGYFTNIAYSAEDMILHGKIEGIDDLVTFESESSLEIEKEFHAAVDDYLDHCKEIGKDPAKTYNE